MEEGLHLLVEGSTANDDLIEIATESVGYLLANLLAYLLADNRHVEQQAHAIVLYLWEHLLTDDLLDDKRHGNDDGRLNLRERLGYDCRTGHACEIKDMAAMQELEEELERHAIHVGHGQNADYAVAGLNG